MGRTCNNCSIPIEEFDPHLTCKICRQPDPNKFYCTNTECKACTAVQSYKPLDYFLRKRCEAPVSVTRPFTTKPITTNCDPAIPKNSKVDSLVNKQLMSRIGDQISNPMVTSMHGQNETNIENRLYTRILSSLLTSLKGPEDKTSSESTSRGYKDKSSEDKFPILKDQDSNVSFLNNISKISLQLDPLMDTYQKYGSHKLSSGCGDILFQNTLLSDPLRAENITKLIGLSTQEDFWPSNINPSFVVDLCSDLPISLKFHPKARQFQTIIFGEFNPKLPEDITCHNFCLLPLTANLKIKFLHSRQKLRVLLFLYSLKETLLGTEIGSTSQNLRDLLITIKDNLESVLISEANCFSLIVQNVRQFMLSGSVCKLESAIDKLTYGPAHPSQFFGPFVYVLQKVIRELGTDYCIMPKSIPILKLKRLPKAYIPFNFNRWKKLLSEFVDSHDINNEDKLTLALFLLPKIVKSMLNNGGKKRKDMSYQYLITILERNLCTPEDLLQQNQFYKRVQSSTESVKSFADDLVRLAPGKLSPETKEDMIRNQFLCGIYNPETQKKLCQQLCLTFADCVSYADNRHYASDNSKQNVENKVNDIIRKRKRSNSIHEDSNCKHMKIEKSPTDLNEWANFLNLDKLDSYSIFCPWTGMTLRSVGVTG